MNRKFTLFILIILAVGQIGFAQSAGSTDNHLSVGVGLEMNMNARENFALGIPIHIDYNLTVASEPLAFGLVTIISNNLKDNDDKFTVIEIGGLARWYFMGGGHTGLYGQVELGAYLFTEFDEVNPMFMGGLRAGYRMPFGNLYVEPFGRAGYPFAWGIGVLAGISVDIDRGAPAGNTGY